MRNKINFKNLFLNNIQTELAHTCEIFSSNEVQPNMLTASTGRNRDSNDTDSIMKGIPNAIARLNSLALGSVGR